MSHIIAISPGATILELLMDRNFFLQDFAAAMGLTWEQADRLIGGNLPITPKVAKALEKTLNVPAKFWLRLEEIYRKKLREI